MIGWKLDKRLIVILFIIFLLVLPVCNARTFNIKVTEKHILGSGADGDYHEPAIFILIDDNHEEYLVTDKDYYMVHIGDRIKIAGPGDKQAQFHNHYCTVIREK